MNLCKLKAALVSENKKGSKIEIRYSSAGRPNPVPVSCSENV